MNKVEVFKIIFFDKVEKLFIVFKEMGNFFEEEFVDFFVLDIKDIVDLVNLRFVVSYYDSRGKD